MKVGDLLYWLLVIVLLAFFGWCIILYLNGKRI